jgi:hypothetical protein
VCATHGFDNINSNLAFDPRGGSFSNSSVDSEHNATSSKDTGSLGSNTFMCNCSSFSNNSNNSWFACNPSSTSFSSTLDTSDTATTSNHSNHAFDPGGVPFNSSLPSLCAQHTSSTDLSSNSNTSSNSSHTANISNDCGDHVFDPGGAPFDSNLTSLCAPHSLDNCKLVFDPSSIPFISSKSFHATSTNHSCDRSMTPSGNKATETDNKAVTPHHCLNALSRQPFQPSFSTAQPPHSTHEHTFKALLLLQMCQNIEI